MIIIFGPPGAGKSMQGQILAARHDWRWLSAGQLLRDTRDEAILQRMRTGELVDSDVTNTLMAKALHSSKDIAHVVLDGFPRELTQAKWLVANQPHHGKDISLIIVLEVSRDELERRLKLRGRPDDSPQSLKERLHLYQTALTPIIKFFEQQGIPVVHISGIGTVGEVHDRIESELKTWQLV